MRKGTLGPRVLLVVVSLYGGLAADWPRFRGPNGTGISKDKDIPVHWNDKDGILWKTALPGLGHSSPIVWGDRVFVQSASSDAKERFLLCLGAGNGQILWSRTVPGSKAHTHANNTLASSTPATDGERVYVLFWDGAEVAVTGYDFQGNLVWQQGLGPFKSQHGPGTSPMVFEDKVYVANDQDGAATLHALDAKTGKVVWQAARKPFRASYATPFLLERPDGPPELIVASTAGITSYGPRSGEEIWSWSWTTFTNMALRVVGSPVYSQGLIFVQSGDGGGMRHLVAVKPGGKGDVIAANPVWEWKRTRPFPYVPCPLFLGEHLYFVNDRGDAGCCVAKTGEILWTQPLGSHDILSSPVLIDGKVYAFGVEGMAYVFPAAPTFQLLAKNPIGEEVRSSPAVADNRLFVRGRQHLICIGKPRSEIRTER